MYNAALNPPFAYQPNPTNVYLLEPEYQCSDWATTADLFPSSLTNIKYNYPPPGTMNWSLGIQHQLAPSVIAQVQYVGSSGWDQNNDRQINTLPLTNDPNNNWSTANAAPQGSTATVIGAEPTSNPNWTPIYSDRWANQGSKIVTNKLRHLPGICQHQPGRERNQLALSLAAGRCSL